MQNEAWLHNTDVPPALLPGISAFARVAHHASFTRAAAEMGVSPSALSQTVRMLERRLDVRLLDRSTRRVGLTEMGQRFLQAALPGLAALTNAVESINELRDKPAGLLRINLSRTAADILVMPHLVDFMEAFPDIIVELHCDNALTDLVSGGFDAGIRLGENLAQDVVAAPLGGPHRIAVVAAPRYLAGRALPRRPEDLSKHRCLNARLAGALYRWEFTHNGRSFDMETPGPLITNDGAILLATALAGGGIACAFEAQVTGDILAGRLVPLLKPWWPTFPGFYLYYSSRVHVPRKLRVFMEFMQDRLKTP